MADNDILYSQLPYIIPKYSFLSFHKPLSIFHLILFRKKLLVLGKYRKLSQSCKVLLFTNFIWAIYFLKTVFKWQQHTNLAKNSSTSMVSSFMASKNASFLLLLLISSYQTFWYWFLSIFSLQFSDINNSQPIVIANTGFKLWLTIHLSSLSYFVFSTWHYSFLCLLWTLDSFLEKLMNLLIIIKVMFREY